MPIPRSVANGTERPDLFFCWEGTTVFMLWRAGAIRDRLRTVGRWRGFLLDDVTDDAVAFQPPLVHPGQHRNVVVHIIVDLHKAFAVVQTMQTAHILLQSAFPGDRHGQE